MIIPERITRSGRVVPAFIIDDDISAFVTLRKWHIKDGYLHGTLGGKHVSLARYVWLLKTGDWPKQEIDHINRDKLDNRVANLRDVDSATNLANRVGHGRPRGSGESSVRGVYKCHSSKRKPWCSYIWDGTRLRWLGSFTTTEEASAAYQSALSAL